MFPTHQLPKLSLLPVCLSVLASASATMASTEPNRPTYEISSFSVSGVTLGMNHDSATLALTASGYHIDDDSIDYTTDFDSTVKDIIATRSGKSEKLGIEFRDSLNYVPKKEKWIKDDRQFILIHYAQIPDSNIVRYIEYYSPVEYLDWVVFFSNVKAKYGIPTFHGSQKALTFDQASSGQPFEVALYCSTGDANCLGLKGAPAAPSLTVNSTVAYPLRRNLILRYGLSFQTALDDQLKAAIRQADPSLTKQDF